MTRAELCTVRTYIYYCISIHPTHHIDQGPLHVSKLLYTTHTAQPQVTDLNVFVLAKGYCEQVYCDHWLKVA